MRRPARGWFSSDATSIASQTLYVSAPPELVGALIGMNGGLCIDGGAAGAQAVQRTCDDAPGQQWRIRPNGSAYKIHLASTNLCLGTRDASRGTGAPRSRANAARECREPVVDDPRGKRSRRQERLRERVLAVRIGKQRPVHRRAERFHRRRRESDPVSVRPGQRGLEHDVARQPDIAFVLDGRDRAAARSVGRRALPDGKILMWSADSTISFGGGGVDGNTYTTVFDPIAQKATDAVLTSLGHDMFCPGLNLLADGKIFVNGGVSSRKTSVYDPATHAWSPSNLMNIARGYQSSVTLSDGAALHARRLMERRDAPTSGSATSTAKCGGRQRLVDPVERARHHRPRSRGRLYRGQSHVA
ncbi:RICIN domain-containing protein, partial [Burkholderia pseudomallei]